MDLSTVVITGANRGIGLELTKNFLNAGQWKIIACCRNPEVAQDLQKLAQDTDNTIDVYKLDVTNDDSVNKFMQN